MTKTAQLIIDGKTIELPIVEGTLGDRALDITRLRSQTGCITYDPGYMNTGPCKSSITFVDGENGVLRYRGYPIDQIAERGSFTETAWLLIFGELPTRDQLSRFSAGLCAEELLHEDVKHHFEGFPPNGHPMAMLSAIVNSLGCYHRVLLDIESKGEFYLAASKIISKVRTIAAFSYRKSMGLPFMYPNPALSYCRNFLHMMFSIPHQHYDPSPEAVRALSLFLILHADHEQNCSTSTVRMVGSSQANLFASVSAGICALWGRLHGGANAGVVAMLEQIRDGQRTPREVLELAKQKKFRLMGFGHRIYKSYDPRAVILKKAAHELLFKLGQPDELMDIGMELEAAALADPYFIERKLYPNVDFYSGIILRALNIPVQMFPVMFAIGRMPGWIAHWYEEHLEHKSKIHRPRQIYTGQVLRDYVPIDERSPR